MKKEKAITAQFLAVIRSGESLSLQKVPVNAQLQKDLYAEFVAQLGVFVTDKEIVQFSPSYVPDGNELFVIPDYAPPKFLGKAVTNADQIDDIKMPFTESAPLVKATVLAIPADDHGPPKFLFQYFDRRRILKKEWTIVWRNGQFGRLEDPGVVIADHLDAAVVGDKLFFRSFHLVSQFLPLHTYFEAATADGIRDFVSHRIFCDGDPEVVIAASNDLTRKRITATTRK